MSYLVTVTFHLRNVSKADWEKVHKDLYLSLEKIRFSHTAEGETSKGEKCKVTLPESTVMGEFDGESAKAVSDAIGEQVRDVFKAKQLKSYILVTAGERGKWKWLPT